MITEQITQVIDAIAKRLGVAAEAVYPMLLKQAEVNAEVYRVSLWVLGVSALVCVISLILALIASNAYDAEGFMIFFIALCFISGIVMLIAGLSAVFDMKDYITCIHNPDMWVVEYVAKLLV